jgi:iron complex outermembrane receptor protein
MEGFMKGDRPTIMFSSAAAMAVALIAASAQAQETVPTPEQERGAAAAEQATNEIVVTGTNLRGVAPVGTNVVSVGQQQIQATGATSTNDVLAKIPQITSNFNRVNPSSPGQGYGVTSSIPNIRNIGGTGTTLVLIDGHRAVGAGILGDFPDPGIVPPGALERVEVVPDGGSSIYGSDAIGGVINLITRRRFDGVQVQGRYGFADDYYQYDVGATVGRDWGSGSLYVAYNFAKNDEIFGRDRDYFRQVPALSNQCAPGNITIGTTNYALPGRVAGTQNLCDITDNSALVGRERRHSVFGGLYQELNDSLTLDIRGYYTSREVNTPKNQFTATGTITSANPYFQAIGAETSQTVNLSLAPAFGPFNYSTTTNDQWGITPSLTAELGKGWQLRLIGNYGRNHTEVHEPMINSAALTTALAGTTAATAFNPYNPAASNPAVLNAIRNYENYGESKQDLLNARAILDGVLFSLPGGDVRVAVGGEYIWNRYAAAAAAERVPGDESAAVTQRRTVSRDIKSVFGELAIPIFGAANGFGGMESLVISGSARYDHYSDVGGTFNPKVGVTWKPGAGLTIRGNWGTSFNAPSLTDTAGAVDTRLQLINYLLVVAGGSAPLLNHPTIGPASGPNILGNVVLAPAGGNVLLKPQEATTYSFGADFEPEFLPGLKLSATYYNINFPNAIQVAAPTSNIFSSQFSQFAIVDPTAAEVRARLGPNFQTTGLFAPASLDALCTSRTPSAPCFYPYVFYDFRRQNVGTVQTDGIDFSAAYVHQTSFGSVNASVAGTRILSRREQAIAGAPFVDALAADQPKLYLTASLGATVGNLTAQATLTHNSGYRLATPAPGQTEVDGFSVVDLFFAYNLKGDGLSRDLSLTLNINNVFDQDPPFFNGCVQFSAYCGFRNGSTLGRLVQFGVSKKF